MLLGNRNDPEPSEQANSTSQNGSKATERDPKHRSISDVDPEPLELNGKTREGVYWGGQLWRLRVYSERERGGREGSGRGGGSRSGPDRCEGTKGGPPVAPRPTSLLATPDATLNGWQQQHGGAR